MNLRPHWQQHRLLFGIAFILASIVVLVGISRLEPYFFPTNKTTDPVTLVPQELWSLEISPLASAPTHTSKAYWIYERNTNSLLAEQNSEEATSVASLAKLMTAYVSYDTYSLDQVIPIATASTVAGNRAKFLWSDTYRVYDLLQSLLIFSANDAAEALAQAHPRGRSGFVQQMNETAQKLNMTQTSYDNPTGLDSPRQFSSARDLGLLADAILDFPTVSQVVRQPVTTIYEQRTGRPTVVYSTNALLSRDPRFQGMKTGTTELAGESLIVRYVDPDATSEATPNGVDIILVLLGSQQRFIDAPALIRWAESHAQPVKHTLQ